MKKNYFSLVMVMLFSVSALTQETQKNFINYQGVARNSSNELMANESMSITIGVKFGAANTSTFYEENHSINTDANGVFSLLIGNGSALTGDYNTLPWGSAATFVTVSINGNEVGTTEMMAVPYAISAGNMKGASADEVTYDNSTSGLTATTAQDAIDELVSSGNVDADADPENELQMLSFDTVTNELSLSDGNTVTIPSGGTDADADPENEIQTISFNTTTNELSLSDGGSVIIPSGGTDADADPENELQTLAFDAGTNELSLSDGNSVTIPGNSGGSSLWKENGGDVYYNTGAVGIGTTTPQAPFDIAGQNNWDLNTTEGDFRLGNDTYRLKMSTSLGGGGAGNARIRAQGGSNKLLLGAGTEDVLAIEPGSVKMTGDLEVEGNIRSSDLTGTGERNVVADANGNLIVGDGVAGSSLWNKNGSKIYFAGGGVGINTNNPRASLEVFGDIRSSDLKGVGERNVVADPDGNLVIRNFETNYSGTNEFTNDVFNLSTTHYKPVGPSFTFNKVHEHTNAEFRL